MLFGAAIALGAVVSSRPPGGLDVSAQSLRGEAIGAAMFFTALGRAWPLVALSAAALGSAAAARAPLVPVAIVIGAQTLSQAVNAVVKLGFHRLRPGGSIGYHEQDSSYPSGHAVTAVVFFAGFAMLAWLGPLPRPLAAPLAAVLAVCAVAIPWSRLALGAHYATDVLGGLLLGAAWLCLVFAALLRWVPTLSR